MDGREALAADVEPFSADDERFGIDTGRIYKVSIQWESFVTRELMNVLCLAGLADSAVGCFSH